MFDELSSRFEDAVKGLKGEAKISENNINDALKEVKRALLDADVSLSVVKDFISDVKDKAIGEEVVRGVNPSQKFIEVVNRELINIMGNENSPLSENENSPTVILMAGLQGAGKTTATGKLGLYLKEKEKKVLLVAADIYRPAAVEQLKTLGSQYDLEVFSAKEKNSKPEEITKEEKNGLRMRFELNAVPLEKWIEKQERLNRFFVKGLESEFIIDDNKKEFDFILFY